MPFPLFVFALPSESAHHFDDVPTLYTGVGKVNAAAVLMQYLLASPEKPSVVVNCGTAGSPHHAPGAVVQCRGFVQRDMDVTALGFAPYQTPFDDAPVVLPATGPVLPDLPFAVCGSGDHFVTSWPPDAPFDVAEMEAYALASVCARVGVPFVALKYISDGADAAATTDWAAALDRAAVALRGAAALMLSVPVR